MENKLEGWHQIPGDGEKGSPDARVIGHSGSTSRMRHWAFFENGIAIACNGENSYILGNRFKSPTGAEESYLLTCENRWGIKVDSLFNKQSSEPGFGRVLLGVAAGTLGAQLLKRLLAPKAAKVSKVEKISIDQSAD